jgi:NAD(P)H-hydrate epimerase
MSIPVISVEQMREWEQCTWKTGQTEKKVIAQVGKIVAARALQLTSNREKILVLAGKGHNGDDARAALPHLKNRDAILLDARDPKLALKHFLSLTKKSPEPKLVVDGLFGTGLSRPLNHDWQNLIGAINATKIPVLAIDAPSGVDADTGEIRGAAIRAEITLTLGAPKRGLLSANATPYVGRLEVAPEIGLSPCNFKSELNWTEASEFKNFPPRREAETHKGTYGHVVIVAGSLGFHGAAILAARGALRAQPGLVSVFTPENVYVPVASQLQAAMVHPWKSAEEFPKSTSAILFGPGLASKSLPKNLKHELIQLWKKSSLPIVADASALDWLPAGKISSNALRVLTPHPGEAARLLSVSTQSVQANRIDALKKISARHGNCFVILKGHQTLVGRADGEIFVNSSGNAFLAQGGSGDVLSGYLSGLLAQPALQSDPMTTIRFAIWQHGATADFLSRSKRNWGIEELLQNLGNAVATEL